MRRGRGTGTAKIFAYVKKPDRCALDGYQASALMAAAARHPPSRRILRPVMPPRAPTGTGADRTRRDHRTAPNVGSPGWLAVANTGDRNTSAAPLRAARRKSAGLCAELVTKPGWPWPPMRGRPRRRTLGHRPPRRCMPARSAAASLTSPATTRVRRLDRQMRARARPIAARSGWSSCRRTTPARPRGKHAAARQGSGSRTVSVKSHSVGHARPARRAVARPQASSLWSGIGGAGATGRLCGSAGHDARILTRIARATSLPP